MRKLECSGMLTVKAAQVQVSRPALHEGQGGGLVYADAMHPLKKCSRERLPGLTTFLRAPASQLFRVNRQGMHGVKAGQGVWVGNSPWQTPPLPLPEATDLGSSGGPTHVKPHWTCIVST